LGVRDSNSKRKGTARRKREKDRGNNIITVEAGTLVVKSEWTAFWVGKRKRKKEYGFLKKGSEARQSVRGGIRERPLKVEWRIARAPLKMGFKKKELWCA